MERAEHIAAQVDSVNGQASGAGKEDEGVNLLDLLRDLAKYKWLVIGAPIVAGVLGYGVASIIPPTYTATTTLLPPQQIQSPGLTAMLGQFGGLAGVAGASAMKSAGDLYVGMLQSRTVADSLVERFKLVERYGVQFQDDARKELKSNADISLAKASGIITVSASDKNPQVAADLANAYLEELTRLTGRVAVTEASQRRLFFETQMKEAKNKLADAEVALKGIQEKTGLIQPEEQVKAIIASVGQVRASVAAKEVQVNSMRTFSAAQNPEYLRAQEELKSLRAQQGKLEKRQPVNGEFVIPTRNMPTVGVEYVRALRNVKYQEALFELLSKQFEMAKIEEAREAAVVQQLDKAVKPERRSKPRKSMIVLLAALLAGVLAAAYALGREHFKKA